MHFRNTFILLVFILSTLTVYAGCSSKKEKEEKPINPSAQKIYEKVLREKRQIAERIKSDPSIKNERVRDKKLAVAEDCSEKYTSCIEKCKNSNCENACLENLSTCEKDLPAELKILK
jgi:hypothetical protein